MCKSTQPQNTSESGVAPQELDAFKGTEHQPPSSGIVVFGSFVAGALVGVIICAPAFMVLLFGAGAALVTKTDSKAGQFFRSVGKWSSDVILAALRIGREFNHKHRLAERAKESTKMAAARVSTEVQKRGLLHGVKARAKSLWAHIDERTAPAGQASTMAPEVGPGLVTDGTQLPFDGAGDSYGDIEGKSMPP